MANRTVSPGYNGDPIQSLSTSSTAQTGATGAGTAYELRGGFSNFTAQVIPVSGTKTMSAKIQGSLDGTNWIDLSGASTAAAAGASFNSTAGKTVGYVRLNVTAIGSTGTAVSGWIAARP